MAGFPLRRVKNKTQKAILDSIPREDVLPLVFAITEASSNTTQFFFGDEDGNQGAELQSTQFEAIVADGHFVPERNVVVYSITSKGLGLFAPQANPDSVRQQIQEMQRQLQDLLNSLA